MVGKFTLLYDIFSDTGTLYGGSYALSLPVTNAQLADIGAVARTSNPLAASTRVNVDLGKVRSVGGIALGPVNASPGAQYRVRTYSAAAMGSGDIVYDSGIKTISGTKVASLSLEWEDPGFWYGVDSNAIDDIPTWLVEIIPEADIELVRWASVEIFDTGNADGYIEFGRLLIARAWRPTFNYTYSGNSFGLDPRTEVNESEGGLRVYDERGQRRILQVAFENLPQDEVFSDVFRIMNRSGISRQVYVVPDPEDTTFFQRRSFLATFRQAPAIAQALFQRGSTAFDFEEVL